MTKAFTLINNMNRAYLVDNASFVNHRHCLQHLRPVMLDHGRRNFLSRVFCSENLFTDMSLQENRDFTYLLACIFLQKGGKVCVPLLHNHIQHILVLHCFVVEEPHNPVFTL